MGNMAPICLTNTIIKGIYGNMFGETDVQIHFNRSRKDSLANSLFSLSWGLFGTTKLVEPLTYC